MNLRFLLPALALLPSLLSATHNRAGEIIVRATGCGTASDPLTACATVITYTDVAQTEVDRDSMLLNWGDGAQEMIRRTSIRPTATPGIQRNEYRMCHRYPSFGRYELSFQDVNRVRNVRNIGAPSVNIPFSVLTSFALVDPTLNGCNNSPELTQDPVDNGCIGSVWTHNPGAFDVDGDSLAFEFTTPTVGPGIPIPSYVLPDRIDGGNGSLQIDPRTGQITWDTPTVPGEYTLAYLVKSFRNGIPLDTLLRDMQVFIDDCANAPPVIESVREAIHVVAGEVVAFEVVATAPVSEDQQVKLTAGGRPFQLANNPATFLSEEVDEQPDRIRKTFRWATTTADISNQAYFVVLRAEDNGPPALATLRTVSINVVAPPPTNLPTDYQLFRPGVQYLYENPDFRSRTYGFDSQFYGVRLDSLGCGDLYGSLEEVQVADGICVVKVPSPFGYRVCQTPDSTVMHFGPGSQLVLYHSAAVGTRWLARDSAGTDLYAEVLSVTPATVLGMTDTLKSIGFFSEDGEVVGPTVTIGKRTGLVDGSRFYRIGQAGSPLTLAGVSEPALGVQLPSASSYGLAQVGDTFQIAASNPGYLGEPFVGRGGFAASFATVVILTVDSSRAGEYSYEVTADLYRVEQGLTVPFALDTVFTFAHSRLPAEMVRQPGARRDSNTSGSETSDVLKGFRDSCGLFRQRLSTFARFQGNDACGFDEAGLDATPGPVYVEDVPFHLDSINTQSGPQAVTLQYLGSDSHRCGTYLRQADILLSDKTPLGFDGIPIEIYPNPTSDQLTVTLPTSVGPYDLALYHISGRRLQTVRGVRDGHTLSLGDLPAGGYLLVVSDKGRPVARRRVMVR
ncbi:putative secreted protein (Por secretion system target) [Neolewinella xylanilytica]|uniref:Putative secreted protein (Por secretion system target) n=1 Tax=Neolewinella xylanilytica TaxID=1514080 RepID=A0A2S6I221_9BACT|nr:T9SS type A sorting domain-containing protein [Neolewinella xylanilytica]PPK85225.1 putative secreted protein (Por secretion system target) [Neolewinella xylanilytica]